MLQEESGAGRRVPRTYEVVDRRAFELGIRRITESGAQAIFTHLPICRCMCKKMQALPAPRFTEDYFQQLTARSSELFPEYAPWHELAKNIPGCARVLLAEGRHADAEAVMDSWKPLSLLMVQDTTSRTLIQVFVARDIACVIIERSERYLPPTRRHGQSRGSCKASTHDWKQFPMTGRIACGRALVSTWIYASMAQ